MAHRRSDRARVGSGRDRPRSGGVDTRTGRRSSGQPADRLDTGERRTWRERRDDLHLEQAGDSRSGWASGVEQYGQRSHRAQMHGRGDERQRHQRPLGPRRARRPSGNAPVGRELRQRRLRHRLGADRRARGADGRCGSAVRPGGRSCLGRGIGLRHRAAPADHRRHEPQHRPRRDALVVLGRRVRRLDAQRLAQPRARDRRGGDCAAELPVELRRRGDARHAVARPGLPGRERHPAHLSAVLARRGRRVPRAARDHLQRALPRRRRPLDAARFRDANLRARRRRAATAVSARREAVARSPDLAMATTAQTQQHRRTSDDARASSALGLIALLATGALIAIALWWLGGPPRVATARPDWPYIRHVLAASTVSDADVITVASTVAWLALGYLAVTTLLHFVIMLMDALTGGARWVDPGLRASALVTLPAVRRMVDGGVAAVLLLSSWTPALSRTTTATAPPAASATVTLPLAGTGRRPADRGGVGDVQEGQPARITYTVARGDSLWDVARRVYGDGSRYVDVFAANRGRVMPGGETLVDPREIRPGWTLELPLPARNVGVGAAHVTYRVMAGDDLWTIAARFLGDGFRWVEIWNANRDREMGGGWRFTNPNLIYPGWVLELPGAAVPSAAPVGEGRLSSLPAAAPTGPRATAPSAPVHSTAGGTAEPSGATADRPAWAWPSAPAPPLFAAGGFVLLAGAALFVHRLRRRGAGARRSAGASGGFGDAGRVALAADAVASALANHGVGEARISLAYERDRRLVFAVDGAPGDAEAIAARRHDVGRRLACEVGVEVVAATRAELSLHDFRRLAASLVGDRAEARTLMVPVGSDADAIVYLNLAALGSAEIVGGAGEQRQLLRAWLAALATTRGADALCFRADDATAALVGDLAEAPHFAGVAGGRDAGELSVSSTRSCRRGSSKAPPDRRSSPRLKRADRSKAGSPRCCATGRPLACMRSRSLPPSTPGHWGRPRSSTIRPRSRTTMASFPPRLLMRSRSRPGAATSSRSSACWSGATPRHAGSRVRGVRRSWAPSRRRSRCRARRSTLRRSDPWSTARAARYRPTRSTRPRRARRRRNSSPPRRAPAAARHCVLNRKSSARTTGSTRANA